MKAFDIEQVLCEMTLEEKAQMCSGRDFWKTQDIERLGIPSVMMCDGPNGLRKQVGKGDHLGINESIKTVCYPTASAVASSFDKELMKELGEELGNECQAEQVGMLLGPGINIKRSPLCGRNFEYFSEDPYLTGKMAAAYIQGLQSKGIAACVKHFAVNNQETRRMSGSSQVDERTLHEIYLPAFEMAVKEGKVRGVMCAYNAVNGTYCAENKELLTDILRNEWGYHGFVVTDWGAVKDRVKGLEAGLDLEMPGSVQGKTEDIMRAVQSGELEEEVLDSAVRNILGFVKAATENWKENAVIDRKHLTQKAIEFGKECAVLLKNEGNILPLSEKQKIAFIGEFAERPRYQGAGSSHINISHLISAVECVEGLGIVYEKGYDTRNTEQNEELSENAVEAAVGADVAVIFAGLPEDYESEGFDRGHIQLPDYQNRLIAKVAERQKNTVVVLHGGSCCALPWEDKVRGILTMHLGGIGVGRATVDILFGKTNPSGKLSETWPFKVEDNPSYLNFPGEDGIVEYHEGIYVGYRYYDKKKINVQFPFGYGLSYTQFEYSNMRMGKESISDGDVLDITVTVKNVGSCYGKEVVQLYTSMPDSAVRRPVRELKGFEKVALNAGEEKDVCFTLKGKDFAYYEPKIHDWLVEKGDGCIEIGSSSRDICFRKNVRIESSMEVPLTISRYTTIGELMRIEKGKTFVMNLISQMSGNVDAAGDELDKAMGEGAEKMREQMMYEMPLNSLVSFGIMSYTELDQFIYDMNL